MAKIREEVKAVNPKISFGTYTGAWYPSYYEVGVNFASREYDPSQKFDWATPQYKNYAMPSYWIFMSQATIIQT